MSRTRIESGDLKVVGVNAFTETEPSPLEGEGLIQRPDEVAEREAIDDVREWRSKRDNEAVDKALDELRRVAASDENIMPATIALAHAGGTTGEWGAALRDVFGEYRAPTGVSGGIGQRTGDLAELATRNRALAGGPPRLLVAKPLAAGSVSGGSGSAK